MWYVTAAENKFEVRFSTSMAHNPNSKGIHNARWRALLWISDKESGNLSEELGGLGNLGSKSLEIVDKIEFLFGI